MKLITSWIDWFFSSLKISAHGNGGNFHLFILFANVVFSIWPIFCYFIAATNVHIIFWMGTAPQYVNLLVPCAMTCLNFGVTLFQCFNMGTATAKVGCVLLFLCVGSVLVAAGAYVLNLSAEVSEDLTYGCGSTKMTQKIQDKWERLHAFYDHCADMQGERPDMIQQCPGYGDTFGEDIFAKYIQDMEYDYNCQGFCRFWSRPLYNQDANPGLRCASAIGEEVDRVGDWVGLPTIANGAIIVLVGLCLSGYDHI